VGKKKPSSTESHSEEQNTTTTKSEAKKQASSNIWNSPVQPSNPKAQTSQPNANGTQSKQTSSQPRNLTQKTSASFKNSPPNKDLHTPVSSNPSDRLPKRSSTKSPQVCIPPASSDHPLKPSTARSQADQDKMDLDIPLKSD